MPTPTVQQYMQPAGPGPEQGGPVSADQMFEQTFGDAAFAQLSSRYPQLVNYVVTFKILDSNVDEGKAFGTFVLQAGKDLRYIPVVMAEGSVNSCELVYDKVSNTFEPLSNDSAQKIVSGNMTLGGQLMNGNVRVEDTRQLFKDMIRPPSSSNVLLASGRGVAALPDNAKEVVASWFNEHPQELAKLAQFYDVKELAAKLAPSHEKVAAEPKKMPVHTVDLKSLTADVAKGLSDDQKACLKKQGYLVIREDEPAVAALPYVGFSDAVERDFALEQYAFPPCAEPPRADDIRVFAADVFKVNGNEMSSEPALITGKYAFFAGGYARTGEFGDLKNVLFSNRRFELKPEDFERAGAVSPAEAVRRGIDGKNIVVLTPVFTGQWKVVCENFWARGAGSIVNGDVYINTSEGELHFSPVLEHGFICTGDKKLIPTNAKVIAFEMRADSYVPHGLVRSFAELRTLIAGRGKSIKVVQNGPTTSITDGETKKTASFLSKAAAAQHLAETYGMDNAQVARAMDSSVTMLFNKTAFEQGMSVPLYPQSLPPQAPTPPQMPGGNMQNFAPMTPGMQPGTPAAPMFNPQPMQAGMATGDPQAVDTGILASFAQDPDIKQLLVDYLPDFLNLMDKLGRIILLLCLEKKSLEEFYGGDKYSDLLGSCRKMLKLLGDVASSLQTYVSMA